MLNERLTLHDPNCGGRCDPRSCVADLESFCRAILMQHLAVGARKGNGFTGPSALSDSDFDDALAYLIAEAWRLSQRFDGRGRLAGFLTQRLFFACIDWKRDRFGSIRYYGLPPLIEPFDPERHDVAVLDPDPTDVSDNLSPTARKAYVGLLCGVGRPGVWGPGQRELRAELEALDVRPSVQRSSQAV